MSGDTKQGGDTKSGADGDTRRRNPLTWRPSPEAELALAQLLEREGVSRGELLNRLVVAAATGKMVPVEGDNPKIRVTKVVIPDAPQLLKTTRPNLSGRPDPDKIAAAQKLFGMGGVKK